MTQQILPQWSERMKRFDVNRFNLSVGGETLASWLSDDVGSQNGENEFLGKFQALDRSSAGGYLGSGNSYHVRVVNGFIFIENQFVEEQKVLLTIDSAIALLQAYGRFLSDAKRGPNIAPEPLEIEFEMEGNRALDFYLSTGLPLGLVTRS